MAQHQGRLAVVRDHALAWLVETWVIGAGAVGGGVEAWLRWSQPISWADYWWHVALSAGGFAAAGLAFASMLDRRCPLRLVFGSGGSFVEEADVEHGLMHFGVRRLYRVGLLNRYTKTVDDVQVRLISREPGQGADMGRRFKEKDTGDFKFSVDRGSGPTRYVDFVWHETGAQRDDHFAWAYEVPRGYANVTPAKDYHVRLEATGRDVRESHIDLRVHRGADGVIVVEGIPRTDLLRRVLVTITGGDPWMIGLYAECVLILSLILWWRLSR